MTIRLNTRIDDETCVGSRRGDHTGQGRVELPISRRQRGMGRVALLSSANFSLIYGNLFIYLPRASTVHIFPITR